MVWGCSMTLSALLIATKWLNLSFREKLISDLLTLGKSASWSCVCSVLGSVWGSSNAVVRVAVSQGLADSAHNAATCADAKICRKFLCAQNRDGFPPQRGEQRCEVTAKLATAVGFHLCPCRDVVVPSDGGWLCELVCARALG